MIKTVLVSLLAIILFSLGAAGSWYFLKQQDQAEAEVEGEQHNVQTAATTKSSPVALPVPVRAGAMSADDGFRLQAMYGKQREDLTKWQQRLETNEQRLKLVSEDLAGQRREVDGLLVQVQEKLAAAETLVGQVAEQSKKLSEDQEKLNKQLDEIKNQQAAGNDNGQKGLKTFAGWLEGLPPEQAAEMIQSKINGGEIDFVADLLKLIDDRNVSKILAALPDPKMLAELLDSMKEKRTGVIRR